MEVASSSLSSYYAVSPVRPSATASRNFSQSLPIFRPTTPIVSLPFSASKSTGWLLPCEKLKLRSSFLAAGVGYSAASTKESVQEHVSLGVEPKPEPKGESVNEDDEDLEQFDDHKMVRTCDKLIGVFMIDKPTPTDWRNLLTFSKTWDVIGPNFYKRCQERADSETDPGMKHQLLRLARKLKEIDVDIQRHNDLLNAIRNSPSSEIGEIVIRRRKDFTKEFFDHIYTVAASYYDNPTEQKAMQKLGEGCLAAIQAYDAANENMKALNAAELKFQDIMNSPSVDAARRKIDNLAEKNQLDPSLVLLATKAWSAAKETNMVRDEAKDIMYHLYKQGVGNMQRNIPTEVRILKYLLTIEDPQVRMSALTDAFTPGEQIQGEEIDYLYTTPLKLHALISSVVDAYNNISKKGTVIREARDLLDPRVIHKLELLKKLVQDNFM